MYIECMFARKEIQTSVSHEKKERREKEMTIVYVVYAIVQHKHIRFQVSAMH